MATAIGPLASVPDNAPHIQAKTGAMRLAAVLVSGAVVLLVTFAATLGQVSARSNPALVLRVWPYGATARARLAEMRFVDESGPHAIQSIRKLATQALLREPINVVAARVAGLTVGMEGNSKQGRKLLNYAEYLSRRDIPTQMAQIELAVADGNVAQALHHYDTALRTDDVADQLLMPTLVAASSVPAVAQPLSSILAKRPPWRMRFVYSLLTTNPWPSTLVPLVRAARLDVNVPLERDFLNRTVSGLVSRGALTAGARLFARASNMSIDSVMDRVRNGDFSKEDRIAPFDWTITDEPGLAGIKGTVDPAALRGTGLRDALSLEIEAGRSGVVARQLLLLAPGRHRIQFTVGNVSASDRSSVMLACNGTDTQIAAMRFPTAINQVRTGQAMIDVPKGCLGQWLTVQAATDINASADGITPPWISGIKVTDSSSTFKART